VQILRLTPAAILDPQGGVFAAVAHHNPLESVAVDAPLPAPRLVMWSGWFGAGEPLRGSFPRDFRTWTPRGWAGLARACDGLLPALTSAGMHLWVRPHARHVLADAQSCVSFLKEREGQPVRLLLDPAGLLTGSMLGLAEEHLGRIFGALGGHAGTGAALLSNLERAPGEEELLVPAPLHRGLIDPSVILSAWRAHGDPALPCVLLDTEFEPQAALVAGETGAERGG
jgi:hypothetical protein